MNQFKYIVCISIDLLVNNGPMVSVNILIVLSMCAFPEDFEYTFQEILWINDDTLVGAGDGCIV